MSDEPVDARGKAVASSSPPVPGRAGRLFAGWSANLVQMVLGITQQVALIPVFLHYWSSDTLAAWLAIYAVGNLVLIADGGLQFRAINRFLAFKSGVDCDGRTARFYAAMLRIYLGLVAASDVAAARRRGRCWRRPRCSDFGSVAHFDAAFVVMAAGMLLTLPSNLVAALYRARGLYGRAVEVQNWACWPGSSVNWPRSLLREACWPSPSLMPRRKCLLRSGFWRSMPPGCFRICATRARARSWRWIAGQFRKAAPFAVAGATELALLNLPVLLVSAFVPDRVAVAQWGLTRVVAGLLRALCVQTTLAAGCRAWPRSCGRAIRSGCAAFTRAARCW